MIVAELTGGLGNQLFQWAFAFAEARRLNSRLGLDYVDVPGTTPRKFALGAFGMELQPARCDQERFLAIDVDGYIDVGPRRDGVRIRGMWMGEEPWRDYASEIRARLSRKTPPINGVAVHIRRTDFADSPMVLLGRDYYEKALAKMPSGDVTVFSDDPALARDFGLGYVVDEPDPWVTFLMMASCEHHVIANSSFSWWAAWLAEKPGQRVVAPSKWLRANAAVTKQIVPERWVTV